MGAETTKPGAPALDPAEVEPRLGSRYPKPFDEAVAGRRKQPLGDALGLAAFGVNLVRLPPGCWSSQRHWHSRQDEFVFVVEGELVLLTDGAEQVLGPGMAAGFPAGAADGHHLINRTSNDAVYLEVGDRTAGDEVDYPDIDMRVRYQGGERRYVRTDGTPYE
jgi:uncharacterized cupin superfamily protein